MLCIIYYIIYLLYTEYKHLIIKNKLWASLVEQWLRICLPMQGTWVRTLVWEDPHATEQLGP